jgi:hypothetical protein
LATPFAAFVIGGAHSDAVRYSREVRVDGSNATTTGKGADPSR